MYNNVNEIEKGVSYVIVWRVTEADQNCIGQNNSTLLFVHGHGHDYFMFILLKDWDDLVDLVLAALSDALCDPE